MSASDGELFNPFIPEFHADPYPAYRRLRDEAPVLRTAYGVWVASRHEDIASVVRDSRFGHGEHDDLARARLERGEVQALDLNLKLQSFLTMDPPDHTRLRASVNRAFTPRLVAAFEPRIREVAHELLSAVSAADEFDLMESFAYPLPLTIVRELLGIPSEEEARLRIWSMALARGTEPEIMLSPEIIKAFDGAAEELYAYLAELIAARRVYPADDVLSELVSAQAGGEPLTESDMVWTCMLLLIAGHETTASMIGNAVLALAHHPDQLALATDAGPVLPATAAEELLRYDSSVQITRRVALEDVTLSGHDIPRGDSVILLLGSGNRDQMLFDEPDRLDLTRENAHRHLSFSGGIHFCLGAALARLELQVGLAVLLEYAPNLLVTGDPVWRSTLMLRGPEMLPMKFG